MKDKEKTIDGLRVRSVVKNATPKKSTSSKKEIKVEKVKKPAENNTTKEPLILPEDNKIRQQAAREDFLEPTKAFDLDISSDEIEKEVKQEKRELKKKEKKPRKKIVKIIEWVALVLVVLIIGGVICLLVWGNDLIAKLTGGESDIWSALNVLTSETYTPLKQDKNGRTNILVFGTSGYNMRGDEGNGKAYAGSQLTDSIMVVSLDQETGDTALINVPRDLKGPRTCTSTGKINELYWCANQKGNNEEAGAQALESALETILGIDIQYHVHINWGSLQAIVNRLDGITVTLDENIRNYDNAGHNITAGVPVKLNGQQALAVARARHGTALGDFSRGNSQQKILIAIKDRILEKELGIADILGLVGALGDDLRTNFSLDEIKTGYHLSQNVDLDNIRQAPLVDSKNNIAYVKTATIDGISYVIPSAGAGVYTEIQKYVAKMFTSDPVVREEAKILALNGSGETGAATALKNSLDSKNYKVLKVGDAPEGEYPDKYSIYDVSGEKTDVSGTLKALKEELSVKEVKKDLPSGVNAKGYDIVIIIGGEKTE